MNTHLSQDTWMCVAEICVCVCVCVCVCILSCIQLFVTLHTGIFPARILEWVAISPSDDKG